MTGNHHLALTDRDRALLAEVSRFGAVTREQLVRLRFFASKTRANERLRRLTQAGYLASRAQPLNAGGPRFVYFPGHELEPSRTPRRRIAEASGLFVAHQLGLVDVRIAFEQHVTVTRWLTEKDLADQALGLVPDALIEYVTGGFAFTAFVEYDRGSEPVGRIEQKANAYLKLAFSGTFERIFKRRFFRTLIVTDSSGRLDSLSASIARLTSKIFRLTVLQPLVHQGPLASIWRRPGATTFESLTDS